MTRVKELALQCGAWNQVYMHKSFLMNEHFDLEKFAELIVRECGIVADQWVNDEDNGTNLVSENLKQHFGVTND